MLNEYQKKVVEFVDGPLLVTAGAGVGKTTTMTYRVKNLIELGVDPSSIVTATFTKKSANDLKEKIEKICEGSGNQVKVSTIHSFCYQYYVRKPENRHNKIELVNEYQALNFMYGLCKTYKYNVKCAEKILGNIHFRKLELNFPTEDDFERFKKDDLDVERNESDCLLHAYFSYDWYLRENRVIDFTEMLVRAYNDFLNPEIRERVASQINYLMIDECQDINRITFEIYKMIGSKHNNIVMVGDMKQAIYGFQGSDYTYLLDFKEQYNPTCLDLPINYRSTKNIVNTSLKLIRTDEFFKEANMVTDNEAGEKVSVFKYVSEMEEAENIISQIQDLLDSGVNPNEIAILYRVNSQSTPFVDLLSINEIPFVIDKSQSIYKRRHIATIISYVKAFIGDTLSLTEFKQILQAPTHFLTTAIQENMYKHYKKNKDVADTIYESCSGNVAGVTINYRSKESLNKLARILSSRSVQIDEEESDDPFSDAPKTFAKSPVSTKELVETILYDIGVRDFFKKEEEEKGRELAGDISLSLDILSNSVSKFQNPRHFLHFVDSMANKKETKDGIRLHTIHSSKGLEWDYVFLVGYCDKIFPFYKATDPEELAEELRISYVGITRPRKKLFISSVEGSFGRFNVRPSKYLDYIKGDTVAYDFGRC